MTDDWDFYFLRVDDEPASIYLNLGLAQDAPLTTQPHMAYVRVKMLQPRSDGLSSQEEYDALVAIEDTLIGSLTQQGDTYAGRNTSSGNRDFYFYTGDPKRFTERAFAAMAGHQLYRFEVGDRLDPDWDVYRKFLYPSSDDLQRILNRRVIQHLGDHGDDPSKLRVIDHFAYLPNASAAASLRGFLRNDGFDVDEPTIANGLVAIAFKRPDAPEQIDDVVIPIARRVQELGGDYDGWGCEVVT